MPDEAKWAEDKVWLEAKEREWLDCINEKLKVGRELSGYTFAQIIVAARDLFPIHLVHPQPDQRGVEKLEKGGEKE